ncbi:unnamed protein product [Protopolystoma xenopodis]|uniref:receptor protein serine/threonine kinase n=1 Tax=Protopolystoma xenopodis TaxID=117903 RepID=A0A3S4ZMT7_9PLAT|nr:unnamed protein product [Protopolystoma xenopodis]
MVGTRRYMAPEVLDGAIQFSRDAFLRIDVYALGLILWELMTRCLPSPVAQTSSDVASETFPEIHSLQSVLKKCDHSLLKLPEETWPPYKAPFEEELGPQPTMEQLQQWVAQSKQRPKFRSSWSKDPGFVLLWETVEECWDQDAEARLSAGCVTERLASLQRNHPPLSTDPIFRRSSSTYSP